MAKYQVFKEVALPGILEPHSIYLIAPAARPDYVEIYVTGASAATVKRVVDRNDIQVMINDSIAALNSTIVVVDIAERNALVLDRNVIVLVLNATADTTVAAGAATYAYRHSDTSWTKISESESMDLVINWSSVVGRPTSAVADIDDAVTKRHAHANSAELALIGAGTDGFTYNGALVKTAWTSTAW